MKWRGSTSFRALLVPASVVAALSTLPLAPARAQVPVPLDRHEPAAPFCLSKVRYFGIGSVTVEYRLERTIGPTRYRVPPHGLPQIISQRGAMSGSSFFESQRWQVGRLLGRSACRSLTHHRLLERLTITDRHGRRVGMITARLVRADRGTAP